MPYVTRRDFLTSASTAATAVALSRPLPAEEPEKMPVVDTHLHCFAGPDDERFPYHERAPYRPEKAATPEHLLACMDGGGVDFAVVVHPEPYQDDHRYLEHCLKVGGERVRGTCLFFCDRPGSLAEMKPLVERNPNQIVAARLHAYAPGRLPPFEKPELIRRLWAEATELGLAMQLHFEPRYAEALEPFVKSFPKTRVIVDHLGRPFQGTPKEHATVVRWARFDHVVMKVSAIPSQRSYPHRDIRPVLKELTDAYGAERMISGGGFNADATPASYRAYREGVAEYLAHLSSDERAKILGGTAAKLFGL